MIRILFVAHSNSFAGAEQSLYDLIQKIDKDRFECFVLIPKFGDGLFEKQLKSLSRVKYYKFDYKQIFLKHFSPLRMIINWFYQLVGIFRLYSILKKNKIEIVYTNTTSVIIGAIAARLCSVRHVWCICEILPKTFLNNKFLAKRLIYQWMIYTLSDRIIFHSNWTRNWYWKKFSNKGSVIYPGFDFCFEESGLLSTKPFFDSKILKIGVIGTIVQHKGQIYAVRVLKYLIDRGYSSELYLFGVFADPLYEIILRKEIEELGLIKKVKFMGFVEDKISIYNAIDILLVPSEVEPFGRVVVEGAFFKRLVVANAVGGIPEIIKDGENGILFDNLIPQEIVERIISVITNNVKLELVLNAARKSVLKYTLEVFVKEQETLFYDLAKAN